MTTNEQNAHVGHRERLRAKVLKNGLNSLAQHEVLEFLLTYAIPRKNTNDIAHRLLLKFGTIQNVLAASPREILKIDGMGENATLFLSSLNQLNRMLKSNNNTSAVLNTVDACVKYFRSNYEIENTEKLYVLCLNAMGKLIKTETFTGSCTSLIINKQLFTSMLLDEKIGSCIIFHTHPGGKPDPSQEDLDATQSLIDICNILGVWFADHIIFTEKDFYSFMRNSKSDAPLNTNYQKVRQTIMRQHSKYEKY